MDLCMSFSGFSAFQKIGEWSKSAKVQALICNGAFLLTAPCTMTSANLHFGKKLDKAYWHAVLVAATSNSKLVAQRWSIVFNSKHVIVTFNSLNCMQPFNLHHSNDLSAQQINVQLKCTAKHTFWDIFISSRSQNK